MKLATMTGVFARYCSSYIDQIRHIYEAGFRYVDLTLDNIKENDELMLSAHWREKAAEINAFMKDMGMEFVQSHAPSTNPMKSKEAFEEDVRKTSRAIAVCGALGVPQIVVHAGCRKDATKEEWYAENGRFFKKLLPVAEENHVMILHENTTSINIPHFFTKTGKEMRAFSEYINHPLFHSCWDVGHAKLEGPQYEEILALGDDLRGVHIHDNRQRDEHIIPFFGTINMAEVMQGLIDIGYAGAFTFEAPATLLHGAWRPNFKEDKRLLEPTIKMQKALEKFLYTVGEHILKTFDAFEE